MGLAEVEAFLTHPAKDENVSSSTQNQALNALLFLHRNVLTLMLTIEDQRRYVTHWIDSRF